MRRLPITWISLGLNAVLLVAMFILIGWTHVHSFWFATRLNGLHRDVCPQVIAPKFETSKDGDTTTTTFFVTSDAIASGCAKDLMESARLTDYLAHPEHAAADATRIRKLSGNNTLYITQVKSLESGELLSPRHFDN